MNSSLEPGQNEETGKVSTENSKLLNGESSLEPEDAAAGQHDSSTQKEPSKASNEIPTKDSENPQNGQEDQKAHQAQTAAQKESFDTEESQKWQTKEQEVRCDNSDCADTNELEARNRMEEVIRVISRAIFGTMKDRSRDLGECSGTIWEYLKRLLADELANFPQVVKILKEKLHQLSSKTGSLRLWAAKKKIMACLSSCLPLQEKPEPQATGSEEQLPLQNHAPLLGAQLSKKTKPLKEKILALEAQIKTGSVTTLDMPRGQAPAQEPGGSPGGPPERPPDQTGTGVKAPSRISNRPSSRSPNRDSYPSTGRVQAGTPSRQELAPEIPATPQDPDVEGQAAIEPHAIPDEDWQDCQSADGTGNGRQAAAGGQELQGEWQSYSEDAGSGQYRDYIDPGPEEICLPSDQTMIFEDVPSIPPRSGEVSRLQLLDSERQRINELKQYVAPDQKLKTCQKAPEGLYRLETVNNGPRVQN